ncbi:class I SAM-dependent methyltransferase [Patescibacteria group bacterium]|nr:class I SAM-dependent methyltransferase [Patescibacteria group bacterium]
MTYHSGNQMIDPYIIFEKARIIPGMHVADFGCGRTGHIIFPVAKVVGETGVIYAVDILKNVIECVKKRADENGLLNVQIVWGDLERVGGVAIPSRVLDVALFVNTLVQTTNHAQVLDNILPLLKSKARIVVVDWVKKGLIFGPSDDRFIDFTEIKNWANKNGLAVQEEFEMGKYHRGVVLFKHE